MVRASAPSSLPPQSLIRRFQRHFKLHNPQISHSIVIQTATASCSMASPSRLQAAGDSSQHYSGKTARQSDMLAASHEPALPPISLQASEHQQRKTKPPACRTAMLPARQWLQARPGLRFRARRITLLTPHAGPQSHTMQARSSTLCNANHCTPPQLLVRCRGWIRASFAPGLYQKCAIYLRL